MPIINRQDASDVDRYIDLIFNAGSQEKRVLELRKLFAEKFDFDPQSGEVSLAGISSNVVLPDSATRIAEVDGVHVVYIHLDIPRVRQAEASTAARLVSDQLDGDLLMVFTNLDISQLHLIYPSFETMRPTLRRMVLQRDLPRRTAVMQLSNIYWQWQDSDSLHHALAVAFDVEAVTRDFFVEYKRTFDYALERVEGFGQDKPEREQKRIFTQTLFNRLMFVYFISRKGWLTFNGNKDYLNALWRDYLKNKATDANFYLSRVVPLFFAGLSNPQSQNLNRGNEALRNQIGVVPFLNGGLFEKTDLDSRSSISVPDEILENVLNDLFDKFNFTVMESTPLDIEVAVDPEMLGKVFEELVTERHDSGAYYTPRPVVSFMCREALKGYLRVRVSSIGESVIPAFVDNRDTTGMSVSDARSLGRALDEVTVVDPACGSGAYLLGMMQELVELQTELYRVGLDAKSLYDLKLEIIQRNLYGADLDPFAVNIAMLRLWLSLAIDYDAPADPPPLPNLDFKILCGDSLMAPDPNPARQGDMFTNAIVNSGLTGLKAEYMRESGHHKQGLRNQIDTAEAGLRAVLGGAAAPDGSVDWQIQFAEVFGLGGFDVAIANPPYVRQERIGPNKSDLTKRYADAAVARSDLYCYFYARGLQLLSNGGMHVFVCSNSWLDVGYGAKLQEYLLNNAHVQAIYESAVERQFSTADINTMISVVSKTDVPDNSNTRFVSLRADFETAIADAGLRREIVKGRSELRAVGMSGNKYVGDKWGGKYLRAPDIYHHIMDNYSDKLVRLGDIAKVRFGIKTGANKFFYLTRESITKFGIEPEFCHPVMTSPQESRSIAVDPAKMTKKLFMCHQDKSELKGTGALEYIRWGEHQDFHRRSSTKSRRRWYDLNQHASIFLGMNKFVDTTARTFLSVQGALFTDNFQIMSSDRDVQPILMCIAMNSTLFQMMVNVGSRWNFGEGVLEIQTYETSNLSIVNPQLLPEPDPAIFDSANWDVLTPSAERWQIDGMVFDALGLTAGERVAVYEGVTELVENRKRRANSARGTPRAGPGPGDDESANGVSHSIVARGKSIYEEDIRTEVGDAGRGNFAVIDVFSEDYEIDPSHSAATRRLVSRHPGAVTYTVRIGHPTTYKTGLRSLVPTS